MMVSVGELDKMPKLVLELDDAEIIADYYGYDYADCYVKNCGFNRNQVAHMGYCLVKDGEVVDDLDWKKDDGLIKVFYEYDRKYGFIESSESFESYLGRVKGG